MATPTAPGATSTLRGGEWLLQPTSSDHVFTPERLSDEHKLIGQTAQEFVDKEILPVLDQLEQKDWGLARKLVKRSGDLGLLGVDVPKLGGVGLDKVQLARRQRQDGERGVVRRHVRRAGEPHRDPAVSVRHRSASRNICRGCCRRNGRRHGLKRVRIGSDALGAGRTTRQPDGSFVLVARRCGLPNGGFADCS